MCSGLLPCDSYGVHLKLQVGINSGSAIAGVIGHKTMQYDLCGDAVNTAARMCSYSLPGHVHVSQETYRLVSHRFAAVCRGARAIKGKGTMNTYFLINLPADQVELSLQLRNPVAALPNDATPTGDGSDTPKSPATAASRGMWA